MYFIRIQMFNCLTYLHLDFKRRKSCAYCKKCPNSKIFSFMFLFEQRFKTTYILLKHVFYKVANL